MERMKMSERHEQKRRQLFSAVGVLAGVLAVLALFYFMHAGLEGRIRLHSRTNLTGLEKAMLIYGKDSDGKLPPAEDANELKRIATNYRPAEHVQPQRHEGTK